MALVFNLRHVEKRNLELSGELPPEELELSDVDEMIQVTEPIRYDLVAEQLSGSILVRGDVEGSLNCTCVRCLRPFTQELVLKDWTCDLPLSGEESITVNNDCVDLTPHLREDILLAFPQHPLCEPGCRGLLDPDHRIKKPASVDKHATESSSAWAELNKLKF